MTLEKKKLQVELIRVQAARMELELKIEERQEEIKRLESHIEIQKTKEIQLAEKLKLAGD